MSQQQVSPPKGRLTGWVVACGMMLAIGLPVSAAQAPWTGHVQTQNPELQSLAARIEEARARIGPAGSWPDPKVQVEVMAMDGRFAPRGTVMQMLPLLGQPGLMARMAALDVDMARAAYADRFQMIVADIRQAKADVVYVETVSSILGRIRDLAARLSRIAEARYGVGKGMQSDVLRAHTAQTKLATTELDLQSRQRAAEATLAAKAPAVAVPQPVMTDLPALATLAEWQQRAGTASPMLRMRRQAAAAAEIALELARRERIPDLEVGLTAGQWMPGNMPYVSGMATVPVPIWWANKQQAKVQQAEHRLESERQALAAAERDLTARLTATHAQVIQADGQLLVYRKGLIIQAQQGFQAALAAYQVDQADFLMVLDSLMALYDAQTGEAMALVERYKMMAMLTALAGDEPGGDLPAGDQP